MNVCRWALLCTEPATTNVDHTTIGTIPTCTEHADEYRQGTNLDALNVWEADPECWCTDDHLSAGIGVPYCPRHGTPEQRGIES